jgi:TusA-related sulfurtransferase
MSSMQSGNEHPAKNPKDEDLVPQHFIDVTGEVCPMTFVHTKLMMERMGVGEIGVICLNTGEPLVNVPRSVREHGHEVLSIVPVDPANPTGPHQVTIRIRAA